MTVVAVVSASLVIGGPTAAGLVGVGLFLWPRLPRKRNYSSIRPILMMLLVELRSGLSVLAALQRVAVHFPEEEDLARAVRIATVSGLDRAVNISRGPTKLMLAHLGRAMASGGSAADAIRRMLDSDLAREKAERLARTRSLPVQMMLPVSLLLLPGMILVSYGPSLVALVDDLVAPFG